MVLESTKILDCCGAHGGNHDDIPSVKSLLRADLELFQKREMSPLSYIPGQVSLCVLRQSLASWMNYGTVDNL